jgi:hypothetical protein
VGAFFETAFTFGFYSFLLLGLGAFCIFLFFLGGLAFFFGCFVLFGAAFLAAGFLATDFF